MPNPVLDCLCTHRSIRRFKGKPLDPETLETILHAGTRAATAGNIQPYSLLVVDDRETLEDMTFGDAPCVVIALVDLHRQKRWLELNDAPFYWDQTSNFLISYWDATIALHNVIVAAESVGLGTLYIGAVVAQNMQESFGSPEHVFPAGMVILGYPDEEPGLRPRLPLEAVVHRNKYRDPTDDEIRTWYHHRDVLWNTMNPDRRAKLEKRGIRNCAQTVTLGHYTAEFTEWESAGIVENLRRAGFRFA